MIAKIVIEIRHVKGVYVHVHECLIKIYFHAFVHFVVLIVNIYFLVVFVTKTEIEKYLFRYFRFILLYLIFHFL